MSRIISFSFLFVLCALFSCTTNDSDFETNKNDNVDLTQRGEDPGTEAVNCCDFEYDVSVEKDGECCTFTVSIWVDYNNCPIAVYGPNGFVQSSAKSYYRFEYNSCENPKLEQATFSVSWSDYDSQTSYLCEQITLDLNC